MGISQTGSDGSRGHLLQTYFQVSTDGAKGSAAPDHRLQKERIT